MKLTYKKEDWNHVMVTVDFDDGHDEVITVTEYFDALDLENEYFVKLLCWLLSYSETEYEEYFTEFMYIPTRDISDVCVMRFEDGIAYEVELKR